MSCFELVNCCFPYRHTKSDVGTKVDDVRHPEVGIYPEDLISLKCKHRIHKQLN